MVKEQTYKWLINIGKSLYRRVTFKDSEDKQDLFLPEQQISSEFIGICTHLGPIILFIFLLLWFNINNNSLLINIFQLSLIPMILQLFIILYYEKYYPAVQYSIPTWSNIFTGSALVFITGVSLGSCVVILVREGLFILFPQENKILNIF